jgi:hypothetical protein
MKMKFYKRKVESKEEEIIARTYRCPNHPEVVLFRVSASIPEPKVTEKIKCPVDGEEIEVPKYKPSDRIT